ncbi:PorT family protein [candidate division KSB1 bacterium]|nr:PorT family protein [candidate division KSB1 bacterium]
MKRVFIVSAILLLGLTSVSNAALRLGGKFGVNFSNVAAKNVSGIDYKTRTGFGIGPMALIDFGAASPLALRAELLFVQKGAKFTNPAGDGTLKNDEIVLAPFLLFKFAAAKASPFIEIGPEVGFNTLAEVDAPGEQQSITDKWKSQNYSLNVGAGVLLPLGGSALEFDARYNLGLVDLSDYSSANDMDNEPELKTNGFQVFVGYYFFGL